MHSMLQVEKMMVKCKKKKKCRYKNWAQRWSLHKPAGASKAVYWQLNAVSPAFHDGTKAWPAFYTFLCADFVCALHPQQLFSKTDRYSSNYFSYSLNCDFTFVYFFYLYRTGDNSRGATTWNAHITH